MTDFSQSILGGGARTDSRFRLADETRPGAPENSPSLAIARLLDGIAEPNSESAGPLQNALASGRFATLRDAVASLPSSQRQNLSSRIPEGAFDELLSLSAETDGRLLAESLLTWGTRQENADRIEAASLVYSLLGQSGTGALIPGSGEEIRRRAALRLDAVLGRGALGGRSEFLLRRLAREASDPVMIAGMAAGSLVFSTARTALLSRMLAVPGRGVLGARALASAGAFLLEVPSFWATTKGLREVLEPGSQHWDLHSNLSELASLGLTLGALKLTGALSGGLSRRLASSVNPSEMGALERFGHGVLQQGATLGGILLGHRLETAVGLRRPVDGATTLIDSLATLLQFHVGGQLSGAVLGPRFQAYTQSLEMQGRLLEAEAARQTVRRWRDRFGSGGGLSGPQLAMANGGSPDSLPHSIWRPQDSIVHMSIDGDGVVGSKNIGMVAAAPLGTGGEGSRVLPPRERGIRSDIPADLPLRTGKTPDDQFSRSMPPDEIMTALNGKPILSELLSRLELRNGSWGDIDDAQFGAAVGEALSQRLEEVSAHSHYAALSDLASGNPLALDYRQVPRFSELPSELRESLDAAAELMQITQYAIRSNQTELLDAARSQLSTEQQATYQELLPVIRMVKGPRLLMPEGPVARGDEVIGPDQAVLSHGAGAMSSWLRVIGRRIAPGGVPWYLRLFATEANFNAVRGIRERGKNAFMSPAMSHNFEGDPPIEPVYFNSQDVANSDPLARILYRTVRVQMLNVPSVAMPAILNEEFVRGLPENAILISAIGGVVEPKDEAPQYPNEFVRGRLDRFGRSDVEVVSLSGYVPADKLWMGEGVMINLSSREDGANRGRPVGAVGEIARLIAGESSGNDFVQASTSHWERSANVGKVAKNVVTLGMGLRAGRIAREVVEAQAEFSPEHPRYRELLDLGLSRYTTAREEFRQMMRNLLIQNEGIKASRADFTPEVWKDFEDCSTIFFPNLVELFRRARALNTREARPEQVRDFLKTEVFEAPRDRRVATTRNPRYGIARALHEMWVDQGLPLRDYGEVGPNVTVEGLMSLDPFLRLYNSRRDIEQRRLPDFIYDLHRALFGRKIDVPPLIPSFLRYAIDRNPESTEARRLQNSLKEVGVNTQQIRQALEGSDDRTLNLFSRELRRLGVIYERLKRARVRGNGEVTRRETELQNQLEYFKNLRDAVSRGNVVGTVRMPEPIGPYQSAFVISRSEVEGERPSHQVVIRIKLEEATRRLTQLGMLLRRFPPEDAVEIDLRIPEGMRTAQNFGRLLEMELTSREILRAFQSQRAGELRLSIDRRSLEIDGAVRREPPSEAFYQSLEPLARLSLDRGPEETVNREEVRQLFRVGRHGANGVMDQLLRDGNGWVMLLSPSEGPIQSGIRSMLTRPEKSILMGVYSGNTLVDTFAVYRFNSREARILSHHLLNDLRRTFPDDPRYRGANSVDYFQGLPVEDFIRDYRAYAEREGITVDAVRPIPLQSTPVEEALVGRNSAINPALLKVFLMQNDSSDARALLRDAEGLYQLPPQEAGAAFARLASPYLQNYQEQNAAFLKGNPLYRLYERFGFLPRQG